MNERIRQLAEHARKKRLGDSWSYTNPAEFEQKFAELIVRECAEVALKTDISYIEIDAMHRIRDRIKDHFGVT
jgi:hypothetical protein